MQMQSTNPRLFAVMRVVDSEICFLDADRAWGELSEHTMVWDSRDECYKAAREVQGLVVSIGYVLADRHGLKHAIWDQQRARAEAPSKDWCSS